MRILCKMFGHIPADGYYRGYNGGSNQYFKVSGGGTDGIRREHWDLTAVCRWCNKRYYVGKFHGPLHRNHPYGTLKFKSIQERLKGVIAYDDLRRRERKHLKEAALIREQLTNK